MGDSEMLPRCIDPCSRTGYVVPKSFQSSFPVERYVSEKNTLSVPYFLAATFLVPSFRFSTRPSRKLGYYVVARETVETTVTNPSAIKPAKITNTMVVVRKTTNAACIHLREGARKVETGSLKA
jgi:hypothetical protein